MLFKFLEALGRATKFIITKILGENLAKILFSFLKQYFVLKGTIFQLRNKNEKMSLIVMHQKFLADRNFMVTVATIFFVASYFLFLFEGATYTKTSIFFIIVTFLCGHDAIAFSIWSNKIQKIFYGKEAEFAKQTYTVKEVLLIETAYSFDVKLNSKNES